MFTVVLCHVHASILEGASICYGVLYGVAVFLTHLGRATWEQRDDEGRHRTGLTLTVHMEGGATYTFA